MSRSSKSVFKVLIVNLDGTKYGVMVDHVPGDKASVTIDQIELAISNNAELASRGILGHSLEYELYDKDFDEFVIVGRTTQIENHSKLRVVRKAEVPSKGNESRFSVSMNDLEPLSSNCSRLNLKDVEIWRQDADINRRPSTSSSNLTAQEDNNLHISTPSPRQRSQTPNPPNNLISVNSQGVCYDEILIGSIESLMHKFEDIAIPVSSVWNDVAQDFNSKSNKTKTGVNCQERFITLVHKYLYCCQFPSMGDHQPNWMLFDKFNRDLKLEWLVDKDLFSQIAKYRDVGPSPKRLFLNPHCQQFVPLQPPSQPQTVSTTSSPRSLFASSSLVTPPTMSSSTGTTFSAIAVELIIGEVHRCMSLFMVNPVKAPVWCYVADSLRRHGLKDDGPHVAKHFSDLTRTYIKLLLTTSDIATAQQAWPFFFKFHFELCLEVIVDVIDVPAVVHARHVFASRTQQSPLSNFVFGMPLVLRSLPAPPPPKFIPQFETMTRPVLLFDALTDVLLQLMATSPMAGLDKDVIWSQVGVSMSSRGFPGFGAMFRDTFHHKMIPAYISALQCSNSDEMAIKSWPWFSKFHNQLNLYALLDKNKITVINRTREAFEKRKEASKSTNGRQLSLLVPDSIDDVILTNTVKQSTANFANADIDRDVIWNQVANNINLNYRYTWTSAVCRNRFKELIDKYAVCLEKMSTEGWKYFDKFDRLDLKVLSEPDQWKRICKARGHSTDLDTPNSRESKVLITEAVEEVLVDEVLNYTSMFTNVDIPISTAWLSVARGMSKHGVNGYGFDFEKIFARIIDRYLNCLRRKDKLQWGLFDKVHYELPSAISRISPEKWKVALPLRDVFDAPTTSTKKEVSKPVAIEVRKKHKVVNPSKKLFEEQMKFLNCIKAEDFMTDKISCWERISCAMKRKSKNVLYLCAESCKDAFDLMASIFLEKLRTFDNVEEASKEWEFFDFFYNDLELSKICEGEILDELNGLLSIWKSGYLDSCHGSDKQDSPDDESDHYEDCR